MVDLLAIYNAGLRAVGEETLVDLDENTEQKVHLDQIWAYGALGASLKLARPDFARKTMQITGTASAHPSHAYEFALPDDHLAIMRDDSENAAIFADDCLTQFVKRYLRQGNQLFADVDTLYIRYVAKIEDYSLFSPEFLEVLAAYLGMQLAPRIAPDMMEALQVRLDTAVQTTRAMGAEQWPSDRPTKGHGTLTQDWLNIYRDATQILGMPPLTGAEDETELRIQLDIARDSGAIDQILDDTGWGFARCSVRICPRTDVAPKWGYCNVFDKPDDCLRVRGMFQDERLTYPLREYQEEKGMFYSDHTFMYLEYVPSTLKDNPGAWPPYFQAFVAAELAYRVRGVKKLYIEPAQQMKVEEEHDRREDIARNTAAMQDPPRIIRRGSWTEARMGNDRYYGRYGRGSRD